MTEISIKFVNIDSLYFPNNSNPSSLVRDEFQQYLVKVEQYQLDILENKSQRLCFIILDKCSYNFIKDKK